MLEARVKGASIFLIFSDEETNKSTLFLTRTCIRSSPAYTSPRLGFRVFPRCGTR